jgi:DNA primase
MERAPSLLRYVRPLGRLPGSVPASRPGFIEPCLATSSNRAPSGNGWIHELEYDGARTQAHLILGKPVLYTSDGSDCSETFASITQALRLLNARDAILDGEVVVLDERGASDARALQRHLDADRTDQLVYYVFDLLYLNGFDLRSVPLIKRKHLLAHLLSATPLRRIRLAEHLQADGPAVIERAREMQIPGIVSKKLDSAYRAGTQDTWVKVRCAKPANRARGTSSTDAPAGNRVVAPSREQLATYWARVAHRALKYLARRPLELVRDPPGPLPAVLPNAVHVLRPKGFLGDTIPPVWIENLEGLLGLVEIGTIEVHPWNCSIDDPDYADVLVFDVEGIEWRSVTRAAIMLRDALGADALESQPILTGTRGIQVRVSLPSRITYDLAQRYSASIAQRVMAKDPASKGRLFIHAEANYRTRSTIGPYSPRARPGFPIAAPVAWSGLARGIRADAFAITHPFHAWTR